MHNKNHDRCINCVNAKCVGRKWFCSETGERIEIIEKCPEGIEWEDVHD